MEAQIDYSNDLRLHHVINRHFTEDPDADFTITCANGHQFHVHRVILKKCLFFREIFDRQLEEIPETNHNTLTTEPTLIHLLLNYLYGHSPTEVLTSLLLNILAAHDPSTPNHATLIDELALNSSIPGPHGWEGYASRIEARADRAPTLPEAEVAAVVLHRLLLLYLAVNEWKLGHLLEELRECVYAVLPDAWGCADVLHSVQLVFSTLQEQTPPFQQQSCNSLASCISPLAEHRHAFLQEIAERLDMLSNEPLFTALLDRIPNLARDVLVASQQVVTAPRYSAEVMFCGNRKCRQNRVTRWMRRAGTEEEFEVRCVVCHGVTLAARKIRMWEYIQDAVPGVEGAPVGEKEGLTLDEQATAQSNREEAANDMEILSVEDWEDEEEEEAIMTDESEEEEEVECDDSSVDGDGGYRDGVDSDESVEL